MNSSDVSEVSEEFLHPPITSAIVYSRDPIATVAIGKCLPGMCRKNIKYEVMDLRLVDEYSRENRDSNLITWNMYRVMKWQQKYPTGMTDCRIVFSAKTLEDVKYPRVHCTFFSVDDEYGEFNDRNSDRRGFSVREGSEFFVNFLAPPVTWTRRNHNEYPLAFRQESIWLLIMAIRRIASKDVVVVIIGHLAELYRETT